MNSERLNLPNDYGFKIAPDTLGGHAVLISPDGGEWPIPTMTADRARHIAAAMTPTPTPDAESAALPYSQVFHAAKLVVDCWNDRGRRDTSAMATFIVALTCALSEAEAKRLPMGTWDYWYANLPKDLTARLSMHDFKRLGEVLQRALDAKPDARVVEPFSLGIAQPDGSIFLHVRRLGKGRVSIPLSGTAAEAVIEALTNPAQQAEPDKALREAATSLCDKLEKSLQYSKDGKSVAAVADWHMCEPLLNKVREALATHKQPEGM